MMAFVYLPRRRKGDVMRNSPVWHGRYRFDDMEKNVSVSLETPDEMVARKRLTDLIIRLQREREGLIAPLAQVEAVTMPAVDLVKRYKADLAAQGRTAQHVKDTCRRIVRVFRETKSKNLQAFTAHAFSTWRASVAEEISAKTLKEYQISVNAFYRWLIATDQAAKNPIAGVKMPQTRGRAVRLRRALTLAEITRLLAVAEHRRVPYLFLLYTGTRYKEAQGLLWRDVRLTDPTGPHVILRAERTKSRIARAIPLHPQLVAELGEMDAARGRWDTADARVFRHIFPAQKDTLAKDLARAEIPKLTDAGVIDWHAFRKTWQTMGVRAGIHLRSAQAILGHSTPELTANAYTDVAGLELDREIRKLPNLSSL